MEFLKEEFEFKIKKCINDDVFNFYKKLWLASELNSMEEFLCIINIKEIPEDIELKKSRLYARKEIPKLEGKLKGLKLKLKDVDQTIKWLDKLQVPYDNYRYKKIEIQKEIRKIKLELNKLNNFMK